MATGPVLVVGAAGDVGSGIIQSLVASGRPLVASGRHLESLNRIARDHPKAPIACIPGDVSSETGAARLWTDAQTAFGPVSDVVISVNVANRPAKLLDRCAVDPEGLRLRS